MIEPDELNLIPNDSNRRFDFYYEKACCDALSSISIVNVGSIKPVEKVVGNKND